MKFLEELGFFWGVWPAFTGFPTNPIYQPANYFAADPQTPTPSKDALELAEADFSGLVMGLRGIEFYDDSNDEGLSSGSYSRGVTASLSGGFQLPHELGPSGQVYLGTDVNLRGTIAGVDGDSSSDGRVTLSCQIIATVSDANGTPVGRGDGQNKVSWPVTPGTNVAVDQLLGVNATVRPAANVPAVPGIAGGHLLYTLKATLMVEVFKQPKAPESALWVVADFSPQASVSSGPGGVFAEPQVLLAMY